MRHLRLMAFLVATVLALPVTASATGQSATLPELTKIIMRTAANYRSAQTFRAETEWKRTIGEKQYTAQVVIAARRPNFYRLTARGAYFDTDVASDGREVIALRTPRNVFTRRPAPKTLIGSDILEGVAIPTPASRILTLFLEGRWHDRSDPLVSRLLSGTLSGPQGFGDTLAYVITFDYSEDHSARLYISQDDWLVRRVALLRKGLPDIVETVTKQSMKAELDQSVFRVDLPSGAVRARVLPAPAEPAVPVPISLETIDGKRITLADLRGKVVLLTFFFTTCPYCNDEIAQLREVYDRLRPLGFEIIAVNGTGEPRDEVKRWADQQGVPFPVALNKTPSDLVRIFGVRAYPTNVLYDREGRVIYKGEGYDSTALLKALAEAGIR